MTRSQPFAVGSVRKLELKKKLAPAAVERFTYQALSTYIHISHDRALCVCIVLTSWEGQTTSENTKGDRRLSHVQLFAVEAVRDLFQATRMQPFTVGSVRKRE